MGKILYNTHDRYDLFMGRRLPCDFMRRFSFLAVLFNTIPGMGLVYVGGDHITPNGVIRNRIRQGLVILLLFVCTLVISLFIQWLLYHTLAKMLPGSYQALLALITWWVFFISTADRCYWAAVAVNVQHKQKSIVIDSHPAREKDVHRAGLLNLIPGVGRIYVGGWWNFIVFLIDLTLYPVAILLFLLGRFIVIKALGELGWNFPPWLLAAIYFSIVFIVSEIVLYHEGRRCAESHNEVYLGW
jgi:hypothetical protein